MARALVSRRKPEGLARWVSAGVFAFALVVLVVPLAALLFSVLRAPYEVLSGLTAAESLHAMFLSLLLAALSLAINVPVGILGGIVLVRQRFFGRALLDALVDLPLALSPVMTGLALLLMFGRRGLLGPLLDALGLQVAFALPGLVVATLFVTLPFTVREVALVLTELGTSEEEAASTLGASGLQTFFRVTLPNIRHGLVLGATLTAARALGEFGAVLVLGGAIANKTQTATTFIHVALEERQQAAAYGMALLLASLSIALLAVLERKRS